MARRRNIKRIDPRHFLDETVNRGKLPPRVLKENLDPEVADTMDNIEYAVEDLADEGLDAEQIFNALRHGPQAERIVNVSDETVKAAIGVLLGIGPTPVDPEMASMAALQETGARVKDAGLDPQSLGDTGKVIAQVVAMLKGGEVTPENGPRIDQALRRRLKKNPSPEEVSHLQALRAQVKDAAGISDWRSQRREKYRSAASDAAAAETARARKPVTSLSSMGIGQKVKQWHNYYENIMNYVKGGFVKTF